MDVTAALGRAGNAKPLEDGAELGAIIRRKIGERGAHRPGGVAEQLHRGLHHRDLEAAAALAQVVQRTNGMLMEPRELAEVAGACEAVELERRLGPEAGEGRGEPLGARGEVRTHRSEEHTSELPVTR